MFLPLSLFLSIFVSYPKEKMKEIFFLKNFGYDWVCQQQYPKGTSTQKVSRTGTAPFWSIRIAIKWSLNYKSRSKRVIKEVYIHIVTLKINVSTTFTTFIDFCVISKRKKKKKFGCGWVCQQQYPKGTSTQKVSCTSTAPFWSIRASQLKINMAGVDGGAIISCPFRGSNFANSIDGPRLRFGCAWLVLLEILHTSTIEFFNQYLTN